MQRLFVELMDPTQRSETGVRNGYLQLNPEPPPRGLPRGIREIEACVCHRPFTPHNPRLAFPNCTHHICKVCSTEMEGKRGIVNCPYHCIGGVPLTEMKEYLEVGNVHFETCELHPNQVLQTVCMTHLALMCFDCPEHQSKGCDSRELDLDHNLIIGELIKEANSLKRRAQCLPTPLAERFDRLTYQSIPQLCVLVAALRTPPDTFRCHHCPLEAAGLLVETLTPYCQHHWEVLKSEKPETADLLPHFNSRDPAVIRVLQAEMKKYLPRCDFSAISKPHFEAARQSAEISIAELLTLVKEVKELSGCLVTIPHAEGVVCPDCRKALSETGSGAFRQLPCKTARHAICDTCYQQSPFLTCPMDGSFFGKSFLTNQISGQLSTSRKILTPHFHPALDYHYCVTLFSELSAKGSAVPFGDEGTLLEFRSSAAMKLKVDLTGVAIGQPTQPGQCVSIAQFKLYENGFLVKSVEANPQKIRSTGSPINEIYFSQRLTIHPNLPYKLKVQFSGEEPVALYGGMREKEEEIEGDGEVRWTFPRSERGLGPVVRLIYETSIRP